MLDSSLFIFMNAYASNLGIVQLDLCGLSHFTWHSSDEAHSGSHRLHHSRAARLMVLFIYHE